MAKFEFVARGGVRGGVVWVVAWARVVESLACRKVVGGCAKQP